MPRIENLADLRKIREAAASRIAVRCEGNTRVIVNDHMANDQVVRDPAIERKD